MSWSSESPIYLPGGKGLIVGGKFNRTAEDCCCAGDCSACIGASQPDAEVVVTGTCDDQAWCDLAEQTYPATIESSPSCCNWWWQWINPLDAEQYSYLHVSSTSDFSATKAFIGVHTNDHPPYFHYGAAPSSWCGWGSLYWKDITGSITCNPSTGILSGTFALPGFASDECLGCTATVTLDS